MLQPLQLADVSRRYGPEIGEMRTFLTQAHLPLSEAETLGRLTTRLREDLAFRRDLTSHVWVLLDSYGRQISHADLLGIVAVAAAGPVLATKASEGEAHGLLRFLMDGKRAFGAMPEAGGGFSAATRSVETEVRMPSRLDALWTASDRKPALWTGVAVVILVLLLAGFWLHSRLTPDAKTQTAQLTGNGPRPAGAVEPVASQPVPTIAQPPAQTSKRREETTGGARVPAHGNRRDGSLHSTFAAAPALVRQPSHARSVMKPTLTTENAEGAKSSLVRRPPVAAPGRSSKDSERIAKVDLSNPAVPRTDFVPGVAHDAYVRPTSLGIMAGNVTYSPAPAYPTSASAAHVEGEVKLEAEVDRDGNVVSTRIISGPDLLREASEDALQRWHYRPYLYHGKPVGMNATVVMDFHLPS